MQPLVKQLLTTGILAVLTLVLMGTSFDVLADPPHLRHLPNSTMMGP
ncbi:MAG: hypothetical protein ACI9DC_003628 [Gammaproteobacteria bacterium]|jgi:hypothetical protein